PALAGAGASSDPSSARRFRPQPLRQAPRRETSTPGRIDTELDGAPARGEDTRTQPPCTALPLDSPFAGTCPRRPSARADGTWQTAPDACSLGERTRTHAASARVPPERHPAKQPQDQAVTPASTGMVAPVMLRAPSLARWETVAAMSSGEQ